MKLHLQIVKYERKAVVASALFYIFAVALLVNGFYLFFDSGFIISLAITDFITFLFFDNYYFGNKPLLYILNIIIVFMPVIGFSLIGYFTNKKSKAAIIIGLNLTILDLFIYGTIIILDIVTMIVNIVLHIIIIIVSCIALNAINKLPKLRAQQAEEQAIKREKNIQSTSSLLYGVEDNKKQENI